MIKDKLSQTEDSNGSSPPRLAVNGVTTSAPKTFSPTWMPQNGLSETEKRRKELEEEHSIFERVKSSTGDSAVIPLSPDPFNRHPSSTADPRPQVVHGPLSVERGPDAEADNKTRSRSGTTSRFSADSLTEAEPAIKNNNRTTLMSVKSIKKLWRKSKEKHVPSGSIDDPPSMHTVSSTGKALPSVPPQRPERPSEEQLYPDTNINPAENLSRLSPQLIPPPQTQRSSIDQDGRRTPQDQLRPPPVPRSSLDQLGPPQQFSIPMYQGRNPNVGPVTTVHMRQASKTNHLDRLQFDQESPYPIRVSPLPRSSRPPTPPLPTVPEQERHVAPKSILKWRNGPNGSHHVPSGSTHGAPVVPRQSFERPTAHPSGRGRRPSVINFGSTRGAVSDLPPSPPIPTQYVLPATKISGFKVVNPSKDSPTSPVQRQTSLDSQSSGPSS